MEKANSLFQIQLMLREAEARLADGDALQADIGSRSDSGYILRLLGFELLLKACLMAAGDPLPPKNHSYGIIWNSLPSELRCRLMRAAEMRMAGVADYSNFQEILNTWSANFVALRYQYEKYGGLTEREYNDRGEAWVANGAVESEADFAYYPNELRGLIGVMRGYLREYPAQATPQA